MGINKPLITVLMPAYNAEKYIYEAIVSVLNQDFTYFELLIINDGSTDATEEIIKNFSDHRIVLINQQNLGFAVALNRGLMESRTDYIARMDADDICLPDRLRVQYDFMKNNPDCVIAGSDADFIEMNGDFVFTYSPGWHSNEEKHQIGITKCPYVHSSVIFKKNIIIEAGGYNPNAYTFEDHLLWLKIFKEGTAFNMPKVLVKVRFSPGSMTIDERWHLRRFLQIKYKALQNGDLSEEEGVELRRLLKFQETKKIKEAAYYSLLSKKYLWDNYQPGKARTNIRKTLSLKPMNVNTWCLLLLSYMPVGFIQRLYSLLGS